MKFSICLGVLDGLEAFEGSQLPDPGGTVGEAEYEKVYQGDLEAQTVRELALKQARKQGKLTEEVEVALRAATEGDFSLAWPHGKQCTRFKAIYNEVVTELKKKGLLGP